MPNETKRELVDFRVDEVSLVDNPAIERDFALIKSKRRAVPAPEATPIAKAATWDKAYVDALPDSAFLHVAKDGARHLPYKDKDGKVDADKLRAAADDAAKIEGLGDDDKAALQDKAHKLLADADKAGKVAKAGGSVSEQLASEAREAAAKVADNLADAIRKASPADWTSTGDGPAKVYAKGGVMDAVWQLQDLLYKVGGLMVVPAALAKSVDGPDDLDVIKASRKLAEGLAALPAAEDKAMADKDKQAGAKDEQDPKAAQGADKAAPPFPPKKPAAGAPPAKDGEETQEDEVPADDPAAPGKKPGAKRLTAARMGKLAVAFGALADVLKEAGVDNLDDLLAAAEAEGQKDVAKALQDLRKSKDEGASNAELRAEIAKLAKRLDDLGNAGVTRSLTDDGVQPVKKSKSLFEGVV
jgi:hypothetical protein